MALRIQCLCIDSAAPSALAGFWQQALGWRRTHEQDDEVVLEPPEGGAEDGIVPDLLFLRVPEDKAGKNRLHLDLRPDDQQAEVARLEALGARRVDVGQGEVRWVVLADPEGNEFCVLHPLPTDAVSDAGSGQDAALPDGVDRIERATSPRQVTEAAHLLDAPPQDAATARFLADSRHHLLLARGGDSADAVLGMVSGVETTHPDKGTEMFLYELGVDEPAQRRGVGTALVQALARLARERGCYGMWVPVEHDNEAALATYRRAGAQHEDPVVVFGWDFPPG
jgi:GNAT superfamily N-acetyltransferase